MPHPVRWFTPAGLLAAMVASGSAHVATATTIRAVALTGTDGALGPGLGTGVRFSNFAVTGITLAAPSLTGTNYTAFAGTLTGTGVSSANNEALFISRGSGTQVLARKGSQAAGLDPGISYTTFVSEASLSDNGKAAFLGVVSGPGVDNNSNDCFWAEPRTGGPLSLMVREFTTTAPGTPGTFFGDLGNPNFATPTMWGGYNPIMSANGTAMQRCGIASPNNGPQWGVWYDPAGPLTNFLIRGDTLPGSADPSNIYTGAATWLINTSGAVVLGMSASIDGSGVWSTRALDGSGHGTSGVGTLQPIALTGQVAPGSIGIWDDFAHWSQSKNGRVSFVGAFQGVPQSSGGIWSDGRFGVLQPIALTSGLAPGAGGASFHMYGVSIAQEVLIADNNSTAFWGHLAQSAGVGPGNDEGIWSNRALSGTNPVGNLRKVFRESDPVPVGLGPDYDGLAFLAPINYWVDGDGRVAFFVTLNDFTRSIWIEQADGSLLPLVKEFTTIDVSGNGSDMRLISNIIPVGASASSDDGRRTAFNTSGDIVFRLKFSDGSEGIFTTAAAPPAPCGSADFNCDGDIGTDSDIAAFFACLSGSCPASPCTSSADFNGDGDTGTDADIESFFRVLSGGSC